MTGLTQSASIPKQLKESITKALVLVEINRLHHLDWHYRREMYKNFGEISNPIVPKVRGWLAVLAAQRVLPLFENRLLATPIEDDPDFEGVPRKIVDAASGLLRGTIDWQIAERAAVDGYYTFGTWNMGGYDPSFSLKADVAGFTSYKAILEAMGRIDPFENAEGFSERPLESVEWIRGDQFTDADWAQTAACGDAAGCAAISYSCKQDSLEDCDPQKLQEFWHWWLLTAIPESWGIAQQK